MQQVLIGIILVLSFGGYWLYQENITLKANNKALEGAIATQEEAIKSIQNDFELQTGQLNDPVEMERKINNGTKHIMEEIEKISNVVDDLDDGLQLQPTSD